MTARALRKAGLQVLGPIAVLAAVALVGTQAGSYRGEFTRAIVNVAIVVALYVFVGNSGVLSFGQVSFVAVGAFATGEMTIPVDQKPVIIPGMFHFLAHHSVGNVASLALAAVVGGIYALVVGIPLMRLSGLAAGIATLAVLGITHNILRNWDKISSGAQTLTTIPTTTGLLQATVGAGGVVAIAFLYQRSRFGRQLRAAREDPAAAQAAGIDIQRQRLWAFALSGALSGFAGGLLVHYLGTLSTEDVYLELTFLSLAMLVVGGVTSLWGAVLGALAISGLDFFFLDAENGTFSWFHPTGGTGLVVVGAFMAVVLIVLPGGLTRGREFSLPFPRTRRGKAP